MKIYFHFRYNQLMTLLMCILTMAKVHFLYALTISPSNAVLAYVRTILLLLFFYILLNYILFKKSFIPRLIIHELLGAIVLADIIYYTYFNSFPSISELQKINLLFAVRSSIAALFKLKYLLFFADLFILIAAHAAVRPRFTSLPSWKRPAAIASLMAALLLIDTMVFSDSNSYQIYDSYGLMHSHIGQAVERLSKKDSESTKTNLIRDIEDVTKAEAAKPEYFGAAKGRNVIVIQVEALQNFVINRYYNGQELTPNLNKLIKQNSLYFDRYYQHIASGGTSDAEFATQLSLYPSFSGPAYSIYVDRYLYGLPRILKDTGYSTMAFHGFKPDYWNRSAMYPALGFDSFISEKNFASDEVIGMGVSDKSFFMQATQYLKKTSQPFYSFLVTLSSHHPYGVPEKYQKIKLEKEHQDTLLGRYLQTINYTDAALGAFIAELKNQGLYDNSIIAIYGDHHAISVSDEESSKMMSELLGHKYEVDEMINVPLIVHIPRFKDCKTLSVAGGQMDFMPTMLNLLGINKGDIKFYGQDLCNAKNGFAASQHVMPEGSFIDNEKVYLASSDGVFEHGKAWNYKTRKPIELELCKEGFNRAVSEIEECKYILFKDLLRKELPSVKVSQSSENPSIYTDLKQHMHQIIKLLSH